MLSERPWLPSEALRDGALSVLLTEHAERWAETWFGPDRVALVRIEDKPRPGAAANTAVWQSLPQGATLVVDAHMELAMARWMMGAAGASNKLNARDETLLRKLGDAAVQDFIARLSDAFGVGPSARRRTSVRDFDPAPCFSVSVGTARVFELFVDERAATRARKGLAPACSDAPRLGSRSDACGPAPARVGVLLGSARVPLSDIAALAAGDVLVLDRRRGDALPLTVNGRPTEASCSLHQDEGLLHLKITHLNEESDTP